MRRVIYKGSFGRAWQRPADELCDFNSFICVALEKRRCLLIWVPSLALTAADGAGAAADLVDRQSVDERIFQLTQLGQEVVVFTSASSAADMLHCNASNGNHMLHMSAAGDAGGAMVKMMQAKEKYISDSDWSVARALSEMPNLARQLRDPDGTGWSKWVNGRSLDNAARRFLDAESAMEAGIGRMAGAGEGRAKVVKAKVIKPVKAAKLAVVTSTTPTEEAPKRKKRPRKPEQTAGSAAAWSKEAWKRLVNKVLECDAQVKEAYAPFEEANQKFQELFAQWAEWMDQQEVDVDQYDPRQLKRHREYSDQADQLKKQAETPGKVYSAVLKQAVEREKRRLRREVQQVK